MGKHPIKQILELNPEMHNTQRVFIRHRRENWSETRELEIDGRLVYKERAISNYGEQEMIEFANRCGFEDIDSFFNYYYKLTKGKPFKGVVKFISDAK